MVPTYNMPLLGGRITRYAIRSTSISLQVCPVPTNPSLTPERKKTYSIKLLDVREKLAEEFRDQWVKGQGHWSGHFENRLAHIFAQNVSIHVILHIKFFV